MNWDGLRVRLYTKWDEGGRLFLNTAPNGRHPEFMLTAHPHKDSCYQLSFKKGYMHECWFSCGTLEEAGTDDPPAITDFPYITDSDSQLDAKAHTALMNLIKSLYSATTSIKRLEGTMNVVYQNVPTTDRVRIVYLSGVVPVTGGGAMEDLVVVILCKRSGSQEEGGASGPPH